MTAPLIIAAVILLFIIILNIPVTAHISFYGGKPDINVRYGFIRLYPRQTKRKKIKAADENNSPLETDGTDEQTLTDTPPPENDQDTAADKADDIPDDIPKKKAAKPPLSERISSGLDKLEQIKTSVQLILELVGKPLVKFFGKIRIDGIIIDFDAADEDAYEAAMLYGKLNAAVYNALAQIKCHVKSTIKSVTIDCLYNTPKEKCRYDGEAKIRLRPASVTNLVFILLCRFLTGYRKYSPILKLIKK